MDTVHHCVFCFARIKGVSFFVEQPVSVPENCRGSAQITTDLASEVTVSVQMETEGLLVLADRWDRSWRAWSGDRELPIIRTNYVLRGVVVEPSDPTIVFRYEPQSFVWGIRLLLLAIAILICWLFTTVLVSRTAPIPSIRHCMHHNDALSKFVDRSRQVDMGVIYY